MNAIRLIWIVLEFLLFLMGYKRLILPYWTIFKSCRIKCSTLKNISLITIIIKTIILLSIQRLEMKSILINFITNLKED